MQTQNVLNDSHIMLTTSNGITTIIESSTRRLSKRSVQDIIMRVAEAHQFSCLGCSLDSCL
eukprot:1359099-Amphidinium_carterae.1